MSLSPFDSALYGSLFADGEIAAYFSDDAVIASMVLFETALASAQARVGLIPLAAADKISERCRDFAPDPASLAVSCANTGVPVPGLVKAIKAHVGGDAARYVHFGATSQDVVDTALVLRMRDVIATLRLRMRKIIKSLIALCQDHRATVMAGRTRSQQAVPTTFGLKVAGWLMPLVRLDQQLAISAQQFLRLSFGGAAGTLASLGQAGGKVEEALADELGLTVAEMPWHSQRDIIVDLASKLTSLTCAFGKVGQDLVLLAQSEIAEVTLANGGGSSTMPHKANPIAAEMLVTLARFGATQMSHLHHAQIHEHERSGTAWLQEWLSFPEIVMACGKATSLMLSLLGNLQVNSGKMRENIDISRGAMLAEAATFALSNHMDRDGADALVKKAIAQSQANGSSMFDELPKLTDAGVNWDQVRDPANYIGMNDTYIDRVLGAAQRALAEG
ncbi:3-carboxy-cis,cis-muconate cycloisomerase [Thalassospira marina]|uniref:3-carboxy-cis,cis-muconate cycloisomerase n=1 Tax=Thalassospira marina TaxID=2048283 RepID=A0ABN5FFB9_9PROT|nr:3-carboxy-cis,cis-muconate cycloisomerase [Thalassospira marina]AUG53150.1 3-carboxy-cis,cis-muconate cycloisomerase [Thalassospira marina]